MSADARTLACYAARAGEYSDLVSRDEPDADLRAFMAALPPGGRVLDWGCGPGNSAAMLAAAGFAVEATDAAPEMAALARRAGVPVRVEPFEALEAEERFDGIWANFSLLHAPRADLPGLIGRAAHALRPGGVLHLGMKDVPPDGRREGRDGIGRLYAYWTADELSALCTAAGLEPGAPRHGEGAGLAGTVDPYVILRATKPA